MEYDKRQPERFRSRKDYFDSKVGSYIFILYHLLVFYQTYVYITLSVFENVFSNAFVGM